MKRKQAQVTAPSKAFLDISPEDEKHSLDDIDDKYDNLKKLILEGSHDEILRRSLALEKAKELRIAAADKHRKLQIKNINELYEYEVEDASAIYKREYTDVQEQIINDLENEREKMKEARKLYEQQLFAGSNSSSNHGNMAPGGRSLRSSAPAETEPTDRYDTRKNNKEKSSSNNSSRKKSNGINGGLSMTIAESCMRSDFLEIYRDIQERSAQFESTRPKTVVDKDVKVKPDFTEFKFGDEIYCVGDVISVFSALSQESISGAVTAISNRDVVVRTGTGTRFSFLISQLSSGRVSIARDWEAMENADQLRAAHTSRIKL